MGIRRPRCSDVGHGEDIWARDHAAGRTDRRADDGSNLQRRRRHDAAEEGPRGVRDGGQDGSTHRSGGVASCGRTTHRQERHSSGTCRTFATSSRRRRERPDPAGADHGTARRRNDAGLRRRRRKALRSIKVPFLYMPSETDLYFPVGDARYGAVHVDCVTRADPVDWGHPAGADANPEDRTFLNDRIAKFLSGSAPR